MHINSHSSRNTHSRRCKAGGFPGQHPTYRLSCYDLENKTVADIRHEMFTEANACKNANKTVDGKPNPAKNSPARIQKNLCISSVICIQHINMHYQTGNETLNLTYHILVSLSSMTYLLGVNGRKLKKKDTIFTLSIGAPFLLNHTCPKIWNSPFNYLLMFLKILLLCMASSVDADQTLLSATSDLGLHCLQRPICQNT